ncbi:MAG: hypothetical protein CVV64_20210 [Candidatus Wallbacteria bacterium HGW-Wallbacteria-1]|uniref:Uncharacterized protein n=1 Tax=Candidatus Wallbacteria bacterium HGW-Wallbacteria-1 TaxID=2013854 RepID=A0A2N1PIL1_9BACT|nr:MAG: hypothetical protein CVV64_20210 [Candidatus Wallbacteria bacterium HGW-Wallbacteria-1]
MKCPHCDKKVSFFSREMNTWGRNRNCPSCRGAVRLAMNFRQAAFAIPLAIVIAIAVAVIIAGPGAAGPAAGGIAGGLMVILSLRLEKN